MLRIRDTYLGDPPWCLDVWGKYFGTWPQVDKVECERYRNRCEGALADCAPLEVLDLSSSPYESATFNQQCMVHILFGVPPTICTFVLSTVLDVDAASPLIPLHRIY